MLLSMGVFMLWVSVAPRLFPPKPTDTQPATQPDGSVATSSPAGVEADASTTTQPATASPVQGELVAKAAVTEQTYQLGSVKDDSVYPMQIELTNRGAAIKDIQLRDYRFDLGKTDHYPLLRPVEDADGRRTHYSMATEKLRIETFREDILLDDLLWQLDREASAADKATFRATIAKGGQDVLEVAKIYTLKPTAPRPAKGPIPLESQRYDVTLAYKIQNRTSQPLAVQLVQVGPIGMHNEDLRSDWRKVVGAMRSGTQVTVDSKAKIARAQVVKETSHAVALGVDSENAVVAWTSLANKYFACAIRPERDKGGLLKIVKNEAVSLTKSQDPAHGDDFTFRMVTAPIPVPAGKTADVQFGCYLGPKSKNAFELLPEYRDEDYFQIIQADFYCCAPAPIVRLMMWLLHILYLPVHNYGVSIVLLVVLVRLILHPVTKYGQVNMIRMQKKMSKVQPKVEELRRKYANDKQKQNEAMMEIYREAGINPASNMLSCLPMMLQMPIWAGLWAALSSTIEMRHAPFDGFWIRDLSGPDLLINFGREIYIPIITQYITGPITGLNLLPILLSITMYMQQKLMPKTPSTGSQTDEQIAQQQKMMSFMTILFGFMLYNAPSGLNLYIMASNIGGIIEQKRIRKHAEDLEKREEARIAEGKPAGIKKPGWMQWLEKQAEDARKVKSQKKD